MADTLEKLEAERVRVNRAISAIEDRKRVEENKKLVGRAFKFRNNYSVPEKPSDYWWYYVKVIRIDSGGHPTVFAFETDKYGKVSIKPNEFMYGSRLQHEYQPMSLSEFNRAWRAVQNRIAGWKP